MSQLRLQGRLPHPYQPQQWVRNASGSAYSTGAAAHYAILNIVVDRDRLVVVLAELLKTQLKLGAEITEIRADELLFGGRLQLDSVDAAQWVLTVERHFDIQIPDEELVGSGLKSLGALADVLMRSGIVVDRVHPPA